MKVQVVIKRMQECGCVEFHPAPNTWGEHPVGPEAPFPSGDGPQKPKFFEMRGKLVK